MSINETFLLAIVIPAFNERFIDRTLKSLAEQRVKDFNVYIGNDGSTDTIGSIVDNYRSTLNIFYKRFENNLGHSSLTSHWQRCINMVAHEKWIWILPDDDMISADCVEVFLKESRLKENDSNLFRFKTDHIDADDLLIRNNPIPPGNESNVDFLISKLKFERSSSIAEYIFSKKAFDEAGGFTDLPLAWGSDDLLWIMLSQNSSIITLSNGLVHLRQSGTNISSPNKELVKDKFRAKYLFLTEILNNKGLMRKILEKYTLREFKQIIATHIFYEYKSHNVKIGIIKMFDYAAKNNIILGGGYIKNIFRLIRFKTYNAA